MQDENENSPVVNKILRKQEKVSSIVNKLRNIRNVITVEPLIGLYQFALTVSRPALENLELEKACRVNLNYNDTVCDTILDGHPRNYSTENNNMQIVISQMHSWQQPIQSFMPLLLILFLGSYSDRYKWRKPFFTIPLLGDILGYFGNILSVVFMRSWSLEVQGVLQKVIPSFFGSQSLITVASTSYIADISRKEDRTFRIGVATVIITVTVPVAHALSGVLFKQIGYYGVLSLSSTILLVAFLYGVFWISESSSLQENKKTCVLSDIFNPKDAMDTFKIMFKKFPLLCSIRLMLLYSIIHRSASDGLDNVLYLYVQKVFQWTPVDYSYFRTLNSIVSLCGNIFGLWLFVKIFKLDDLMLLFITIIGILLANIFFGFASSTKLFYSGAFISAFIRLNRIAKRSYATKIASENDTGKIISLLGIADAVAPMIAIPIYNLIYQHTFQIIPTTIFFFSVFLLVICCFIIGIMYWKDKNYARKNQTPDREGQNVPVIIETTHM